MSISQEPLAPEGAIATTPAPRRVTTGPARVNLIPPEIAEARRLRSVQAGIGGVLLASIAGIALLYVQQSHAEGAAKQDLAAATAEHGRLEAEQSRLGNVNVLYAQVDSAKAMLTSATAPRILWSRYLEDIRLRLPEHVWLSSFTATETLAGAPASAATPSAARRAATTAAGASATAATTPAGTTPAGTTPAAAVPPVAAAAADVIGTLVFNGAGYTHNDVADWLDRLAGLKAVTSPYLTSSTEALVGTSGTKVPTVNWSTTAQLTSKALASADGRKG